MAFFLGFPHILPLRLEEHKVTVSLKTLLACFATPNALYECFMKCLWPKWLGGVELNVRSHASSLAQIEAVFVSEVEYIGGRVTLFTVTVSLSLSMECQWQKLDKESNPTWAGSLCWVRTFKEHAIVTFEKCVFVTSPMWRQKLWQSTGCHQNSPQTNLWLTIRWQGYLKTSHPEHCVFNFYWSVWLIPNSVYIFASCEDDFVVKVWVLAIWATVFWREFEFCGESLGFGVRVWFCKENGSFCGGSLKKVFCV